jgi:hypothetical protein
MADLKEENRKRRLDTAIKNIEQALTPPEDKEIEETPKERQARHVTETQFRPQTPSPLSQEITFNHELHKRLDPGPPIDTTIIPAHVIKARTMLAETKQRCLETHIT